MAETLYWMHTDPVTGSVVKGGLREDFEPLGQKIDATPPFEEDPPPDPPNICNTTVDSEWQCAAADAMGKTFYEQPTHCQKNYHQEQWRVRIVKKEGNPITLTDSPIPGGSFGPNSPSNSYSTRLMASAMTATAKDDPIDGNGGCDWDKDGTNDCAATIKNPGPDVLDNFKDAGFSSSEILSLSGANEDYKYLTDQGSLIRNIKEIINYAKRKPECTKAFEAVGAMPIGEQLSSLTIVTQSIFNEPQYDINWTLGTGVGKGMRETLREHSTTRDVSTNGTAKYLREDFTFFDTNRRFLGVTNSASDGFEYLSVVVIHSLVHTGGVGGQEPSWKERLSLRTRVETHDLSFLGRKYKDILKHCTRERGSKRL